MDLLNGTTFVMDTHQAMDKQGQRYLVALTKATYDFPETDTQLPTLAEVQLPIYAEDIFEGEPGISNVFFECDYALRKSQCDVILKATAYAPGAVPVEELIAGFRIGNCQKAVRVVGNRTWQGLLSLSPSKPEPFIEIPITYTRAFGGSIPPQDDKDSGLHYAYNPLGRGYAKGKYLSHRKGTAVPNLESLDKKITRCNDTYTPCSFGPIGRSWEPRLPLAGTYDEHWKENAFPLLPDNFDEEFFQCAPKDQQIPFPVGGEPITLVNLNPKRARIDFHLPDLELPMALITRERQQVVLSPVVDCLAIDAEKQQFTVLWRAHYPVKRSTNEILVLGIGKVSHCYWRSLAMGTESCNGSFNGNEKDLMTVTEAVENCDDCGMSS